MKLDSLVINRYESYQTNAGQLYGSVCFKGEDGEIKVNLTPSAMSRLIAAISSDVSIGNKKINKALPHAVDDAISGPLLLESDGEIL